MENTHAAHSVFATACALNVPASTSARPSSALINPFSGTRPIFAYARSVFATFCAWNVPDSASARPSPPPRAPAPSSHMPKAWLPQPAR